MRSFKAASGLPWSFGPWVNSNCPVIQNGVSLMGTSVEQGQIDATEPIQRLLNFIEKNRLTNAEESKKQPA
jgi:hypothetical protein